MLVVADDAVRVRLRLVDPQPAGDVVGQPRDLRGDLGRGAGVPSRPRDAAAAAGDLTSDALPEAESAPFAVLVLVARGTAGVRETIRVTPGGEERFE